MHALLLATCDRCHKNPGCLAQRAPPDHWHPILWLIKRVGSNRYPAAAGGEGNGVARFRPSLCSRTECRMFVVGVAATAVRSRLHLPISSEPESTVETLDLAARRALLSKNCTAELTWSLFTLFDVKPEPCWSPRVRSVRLYCHVRSVNEQCDAASNRTLKPLPRDGVWRHPCFFVSPIAKVGAEFSVARC